MEKLFTTYSKPDYFCAKSKTKSKEEEEKKMIVAIKERATQCTDKKSKKSVERQNLCRVVEHGLEVSNLHCLKSYKIRSTITNFQKLNFKNELYLTLKNKSL